MSHPLSIHGRFGPQHQHDTRFSERIINCRGPVIASMKVFVPPHSKAVLSKNIPQSPCKHDIFPLVAKKYLRHSPSNKIVSDPHVVEATQPTATLGGGCAQYKDSSRKPQRFAVVTFLQRDCSDRAGGLARASPTPTSSRVCPMARSAIREMASAGKPRLRRRACACWHRRVRSNTSPTELTKIGALGAQLWPIILARAPSRKPWCFVMDSFSRSCSGTGRYQATLKP